MQKLKYLKGKLRAWDKIWGEAGKQEEIELLEEMQQIINLEEEGPLPAGKTFS